MFMFRMLRTQNKQKKFFARLPIRMYILRTFLAVDAITFEEVTEFKQNLVGIVYV